MSERKYFGDFVDRASVACEFAECADKWSKPVKVVEGFPTDDEILFASYEIPGYEGYALALYERDGKLYEVHGSHCSCYGLEGQWKPEETSWAALAMRPRDDFDIRNSGDDDARAAFWRLVDQRVTSEAK